MIFTSERQSIKLQINYFTFSTIALNASGWFMAKSASTFRLIRMFFSFNSPMNREYDNP